MADLSPTDIKSYISEIQKQPGKTTVRADFRFLSSLYTMAVHWDARITENPIMKYNKTGLGQAKERTTWLTDAQVEVLISSCLTQLHRCLVTVAVDTGMRKQEVLGLHENEIDFNKKVIILGNIDSTRTKTGRSRKIPLTQRAQGELEKPFVTHKVAH